MENKMNRDETTKYLLKFALEVLEANDLQDTKNNDNWTIGKDIEKHLEDFANVESRLKQTEELLEEMYDMYVKNTEEGRVIANVIDQIDLDERVRFVIYGY